jgi:predicted DCC family thiol-disulfide oxidoreductase YuxK
MDPLRVLYNSVCPVCREGICMFERRTKTGPDGVDYIDVSRTPKAFEAEGVSLDDVRFKLHAISADGTMLRGWPAIAALWRRTPGFGWLATLGSLPIIDLFSRASYDITARLLWQWNRLSKRW